VLNASGSETLPITVYESIPGAQTVDVGQVEYRLETGEAERIGVEHVSRAQKKSDDERTDADECDAPLSGIAYVLVVSVLQTQASAIRMLQARIETIKQYLEDVETGHLTHFR